MNIAKKIVTCALVFSTFNSFGSAAAATPKQGFFQKAGKLFSGADWYKGGELASGEVAKTLGAYAAIAGVASYVVYNIVQTAKERAEQAKEIAVIKPKFEKFAANYQQLLEEAVLITQASLADKPVKNTLHVFYLAQKKQNSYELLDMISAHIGKDISSVIEEFVKDFDAVVATPAANRKDRLMAALTNLGAFMEWVFTGQFNRVQIPAAEQPVAKSVVKPEQSTTKEKATRAPRKASRSRK